MSLYILDITEVTLEFENWGGGPSWPKINILPDSLTSGFNRGVLGCGDRLLCSSPESGPAFNKMENFNFDPQNPEMKMW